MKMKELYIKFLSCLFKRVGDELERVTGDSIHPKQVQTEKEKKEFHWESVKDPKKNLN